MTEDEVKRPRYLAQIQRFDEQARVSNLPAAAATHEAVQLLVRCPPLPRRLLLEGPEGPKIALSIDDLLHYGGTESADQLVLQVFDADVETEPFHLDASEVGAEAGALEAAPEVALLPGVTKTRQSDAEPPRPEVIQEAPDGLGTPNWDDRNPLCVEIPTTALGKRLERYLVTASFNEDDRTQVGPCGGHEPRLCSARTSRMTWRELAASAGFVSL
jgi:hypothetical protein